MLTPMHLRIISNQLFSFSLTLVQNTCVLISQNLSNRQETHDPKTMLMPN